MVHQITSKKFRVVFDQRNGEIDFAVWQVNETEGSILSWQSHLNEWTDCENEESRELLSGELYATFIGSINDSGISDIADFDMSKVYEVEFLYGLCCSPVIKYGDFIARIRS